MNAKTLHMVAWILLIVGGLNWLLMGLLDWEIGDLLGGSSALLSKLIYLLVGISAVYELATHKNACKLCGTNSSTSGVSM